MIGVLAAAGSANPTAIIAPTILATSAGTIAAIVAARALQRFYPQRRDTTTAATEGRS
jgi:spore maturation protein SpmA